MAFWGLVDDRLELHSPLPPEECAKRLNDSMDNGRRLFGDMSVVGSASSTSLTAHVRISYRNSFQTYLRAHLEDESGGTRFKCRFGVSVFVRIFFAFWFGSIILPSIPEVVSNFEAHRANTTDPSFSFVLVALGIGLVAFGHWLSRNEKSALIRFVCDTVDAKERVSPVTA